MKAKELFDAGRLGDAVASLGAELRDDPSDVRRRTFLFELLCFSGEYGRAEKQLEALAQGGKNSELGALVYRAALQAERTRQEMFQSEECPKPESGEEAPVSGVLNGTPFESIEDADERIGSRLEVFAAGSYLWLPFRHLASLEMTPPRRLRDLLWSPAAVRTGPGFKDRELGEVLLPVISPLSWRHADDQVRLGRTTNWEDVGGQATPFGQKTLLVDGEEFPLLEVRSLTIHGEGAGSANSDAPA